MHAIAHAADGSQEVTLAGSNLTLVAVVAAIAVVALAMAFLSAARSSRPTRAPRT